ncbi:hypothetical protein JOD43_002611 [Pullulanibacillus pueri]|uniref:Sin domain-containing protein n=1 Tax=Pullulanibacillus pueri TaxID=1437324 RepID=A0A8J2ZW20_9BACL|nr:anti-repressor SinI family protein [Pullulanibacillus pueri]MBM7682434.1 hypothetical protein [Pullulanibacillus pueri]GGH81655.1 hypothetical protein GCM10007096_19870 [Pullulanibacillus pueri]
MKRGIDKEWLYMMLLAKELGVTKEEVRECIHVHRLVASSKESGESFNTIKCISNVHDKGGDL